MSFVLENMFVSILESGFAMHDIGSMCCGTTANLPVTLRSTRFNIQEFYMVIISSLGVLCLSENKPRLVPLTA